MNFGHIYWHFDNIDFIYKIEPLWHFSNKVLFAPTSHTKIIGSDSRLIQFWLSLYPMLLFPRTPFKLASLSLLISIVFIIELLNLGSPKFIIAKESWRIFQLFELLYFRSNFIWKMHSKLNNLTKKSLIAIYFLSQHSFLTMFLNWHNLV